MSFVDTNNIDNKQADDGDDTDDSICSNLIIELSIDIATNYSMYGENWKEHTHFKVEDNPDFIARLKRKYKNHHIDHHCSRDNNIYCKTSDCGQSHPKVKYASLKGNTENHRVITVQEIRYREQRVSREKYIESSLDEQLSYPALKYLNIPYNKTKKKKKKLNNNNNNNNNNNKNMNNNNKNNNNNNHNNNNNNNINLDNFSDTLTTDSFLGCSGLGTNDIFFNDNMDFAIDDNVDDENPSLKQQFDEYKKNATAERQKQDHKIDVLQANQTQMLKLMYEQQPKQKMELEIWNDNATMITTSTINARRQTGIARLVDCLTNDTGSLYKISQPGFDCCGITNIMYTIGMIKEFKVEYSNKTHSINKLLDRTEAGIPTVLSVTPKESKEKIDFTDHYSLDRNDSINTLNRMQEEKGVNYYYITKFKKQPLNDKAKRANFMLRTTKRHINTKQERLYLTIIKQK